jgi:hypothetical protein
MGKDKISLIALAGFFLVILITLIVFFSDGPFRMVLPFSLPFLMVLLFRKSSKGFKK